MEALLKEEDWHYQTPKLPMAIETVSIGVDGTCVLLCEDGFRQAMVGTISLYDHQGERQHTTYIAAALLTWTRDVLFADATGS